MFNDILTKANIKTRTLFERYCRIADEKTALIMACAEGGQTELVQPILDLEKTDQQILMEETYAHLVPRQELYPEPVCLPDIRGANTFALDDFHNNGDEDDIEIIYPPSEDAPKNKNDDE